jgi:hypothetical protein
MKTTRRDFIKIASVAAGGLAFAPVLNRVPGFMKGGKETRDDSQVKPAILYLCY